MDQNGTMFRGAKRVWPEVHAMENTIPKRLIQTGRQFQPLINRAAIANLRALNPDFEYAFFDDLAVEQFFDEEFPEYRQVFRRFRFPIQRYDFFRYLAVYRYGGFYLDLDVFLAFGLSSLLDCSSVFPFEGLTINSYLRDVCKMDWEIGNYAFGAAPGHPFLKAVIDNCAKAQEDPAWTKPMMRGTFGLMKSEYTVLNTTGPGLLSRTLAENPELAKTVTVLFPDDVCDVDKWHQFGELGVHLMGGSWRARTHFVRRRLALFVEGRKQEQSLKYGLKLGKQRQHIGNTNTASLRERAPA
jgi:inositol phosphorylceramide mannosyltransferase catalytic subunit